jgi:hypothetical protein
MSDDKRYFYQQRVHLDAPPEYKRRALEEARRVVGIKLFDVLYSNRLPAVVDIQEIIEPNDVMTASQAQAFESMGAEYYPFVDRYATISYRVDIYPVQHHHVTFESAYPVLGNQYFQIPNPTFLQRLKFLFTSKAAK